MRYITLILFILFGATVSAQSTTGKISGLVLDSTTQKPIPYATITLFQKPSTSPITGGITSEKGTFELKVKPGVYSLKITFIGYETFVKDSLSITPEKPNINFSKIFLNQKTLQTGTAVITDTRKILDLQIDKKTFNVDKNYTVQGGTAVNVLDNVPSVSIDNDGNVNLRGSSNVTILIDGKPSNLQLNQIPASSIETIELITNPSAKYDPDGMSGIINIVLKKNKAIGFNGIATATVGYGNKYSGGLNLNYRGKKFNVFTNLNYRYWDLYSINTADRRNFLSDSIPHLVQRADGDNLSKSTTIRLGGDWYINDLNTLSANINYVPGKDTSSELTKFHIYDKVDNPKLNYDGNSNNGTKNETFDATLAYRKTFKGSKKEFNASALWSKANSNTYSNLKQAFENSVYPDQGQISFNNGFTQTFTGQADFSKPVKGNGKFEAGVKAIIRTTDRDLLFERRNTTTGDYYNDTTVSNRFVYDEKILSAYTTYGRSITSKLSFQGGLRFEQTYTKSTQITQDKTFPFNYFNIFPNAAFVYKKKEGFDFGISYSKRVNRPGFMQVNPFKNYSDPLNIFVGNPYLKPEYAHSLEANMIITKKKFTFTPSVFFRRSFNEVTRFRQVDAMGVSTTSFYNLNKSSNYGIDVTYVGDLKKWLNINANASFFYYQVDASNLLANLTNQGFSYTAKLVANVKLPKGYNLQLMENYRGKVQRAIGTIAPINYVDISVRKEVLKGKGTLNVSFSDIFNQRQFHILIADKGQGFSQDMVRKMESRIFLISFNYRFGKAEFTKSPTKKPEPESRPMDMGL